MQCPHCGQRRLRIDVHATVDVSFDEDGEFDIESDESDHTWDDDSHVFCLSCCKTSEVADCTIAFDEHKEKAEETP